MTNTDTADAAATARQVAELAEAGSEIVRITVNNRAAAARVAEIRARLRDEHGADVPLVGDFHYNGHTLLREFPDCADALDKYRINPGNVGRGARHDANFATMVEAAIDHAKPVRIGVNAGLARPRAHGPAHGRERPPRRALGRRRGAARGDGAERALLGRGRRGARPARRPHRALVQDEPPPGHGRRLPRPGGALRLPAPPRPDRGGDGQQGHRLDDRRAGHPAAGRHRRHDPREPHPRAGRRPGARGPRVPRAAAEPRPALVPPRGHGLPRLRAHHQHGLPGAGPDDRAPPRRAAWPSGGPSAPASPTSRWP